MLLLCPSVTVRMLQLSAELARHVRDGSSVLPHRWDVYLFSFRLLPFVLSLSDCVRSWSPQILADCNDVSPEPSPDWLRSAPPALPSERVLWESLLPPLDLLQQLHTFLELGAVLQMGPHTWPSAPLWGPVGHHEVSSSAGAAGGAWNIFHGCPWPSLVPCRDKLASGSSLHDLPCWSN